MPSLVRKESYGSVKVFWLDHGRAIDALRLRARQLLERFPEVDSVGLFGSLARGKAVPGSDADLLILLTQCDEPFERRAWRFQPEFAGLGIGVDLFCYTLEEAQSNPFASQAMAAALWLATCPKSNGKS